MLWMNTYKVKDLPDPSKPIDEPAPDLVGDFYVRLGMAVAAWQFVENSLIHTYARIVKANNYAALAASFHTPSSFRARLDMTSAAIEQSELDSEIKASWAKIYKSAVEKSKKRNIIAHSQVMFDPSKKRQQQMFLAKDLYNPAKHKDLSSQSSVVSMKELDDFRVMFEMLQNEIASFDRLLLDKGYIYKT